MNVDVVGKHLVWNRWESGGFDGKVQLTPPPTLILPLKNMLETWEFGLKYLGSLPAGG
jgi:hypothetical protein